MEDLSIDVEKVINEITNFISGTLKKSGKNKLIIAVSGGIDSAVVLALCVKAVGKENIFSLSLPYSKLNPEGLKLTELLFSHFEISEMCRETIDIKKSVDSICTDLKISEDKLRRGNVMARARMIYLYDRAKKHNAIVCGTENNSEYHLGYFTRFGDEASDLEPIRNLYKTQVYEIAKKMGIPEDIIYQDPTAGLWEDQADENQLGFTYKEADEVLYLHFEKGIPFEKISAVEYPHKDLIKKVITENEFKHFVPYLKE